MLRTRSTSLVLHLSIIDSESKMLGSLFFLLFGDTIFALLLALSGSLRQSPVDAPIHPDASAFIEKVNFMFPDDFLARYPHEANSYRLKIFAYLIFNLLVKGYGSVGPEKVWLNYNRDDYNRVLIDAVFHEYLTNFADGQDKDFLFNLSVSTSSNPPVSTEDIAVDRIGEYLDRLTETEYNPERLRHAYEKLSELQTSECEMQTIIQSSGKPGIDYPNFCDIPETSFSCDGKRIPGIYADFQTGCQVFHVCWPGRIDSFLCPIGTIFNQSLLTCDRWYATGCYSSPLFFDREHFLVEGISTERDIPEYDGSCQSLLNKPLRLHLKFLPAKCEVIDKEVGKRERVETKPREKDAVDFQMRIETAYDLVREMLNMLKEVREELADQMKNRGDPWIHVLAKHLDLKSSPKPTVETMEEVAETMEEATEFTRELGETDFKLSKTVEQENHSEKLSSETKPDLSVTMSTFLEPSKLLDKHINSRMEDVPEIVMESLSLRGNILNEGIPLTKQLIIDSYRKIQSNQP